MCLNVIDLNRSSPIFSDFICSSHPTKREHSTHTADDDDITHDNIFLDIQISEQEDTLKSSSDIEAEVVKWFKYDVFMFL